MKSSSSSLPVYFPSGYTIFMFRKKHEQINLKVGLETSDSQLIPIDPRESDAEPISTSTNIMQHQKTHPGLLPKAPLPIVLALAFFFPGCSIATYGMVPHFLYLIQSHISTWPILLWSYAWGWITLLVGFGKFGFFGAVASLCMAKLLKKFDVIAPVSWVLSLWSSLIVSLLIVSHSINPAIWETIQRYPIFMSTSVQGSLLASLAGIIGGLIVLLYLSSRMAKHIKLPINTKVEKLNQSGCSANQHLVSVKRQEDNNSKHQTR